MDYLEVLKSIAIQFIAIVLISTLVTFWVGCTVVTLVFRLQNRGKGERDHA